MKYPIMVKKLIAYFKESYEELKKVQWPNRKETIQYTLVVLGVSLFLASFLGAVDFGLNYLLELVIS